MNPAWVVAAIGMGGIVFQAGIAYVLLGLTRTELKAVRERTEKNSGEIAAVDKRVDQLDWRQKSTDERMERHDNQFHVMGGQMDRLRERSD